MKLRNILSVSASLTCLSCLFGVYEPTSYDALYAAFVQKRHVGVETGSIEESCCVTPSKAVNGKRKFAIMPKGLTEQELQVVRVVADKNFQQRIQKLEKDLEEAYKNLQLASVYGVSDPFQSNPDLLTYLAFFARAEGDLDGAIKLFNMMARQGIRSAQFFSLETQYLRFRQRYPLLCALFSRPVQIGSDSFLRFDGAKSSAFDPAEMKKIGAAEVWNDFFRIIVNGINSLEKTIEEERKESDLWLLPYCKGLSKSMGGFEVCVNVQLIVGHKYMGYIGIECSKVEYDNSALLQCFTE